MFKWFKRKKKRIIFKGYDEKLQAKVLIKEIDFEDLFK